MHDQPSLGLNELFLLPTPTQCKYHLWALKAFQWNSRALRQSCLSQPSLTLPFGGMHFYYQLGGTGFNKTLPHTVTQSINKKKTGWTIPTERTIWVNSQTSLSWWWDDSDFTIFQNWNSYIPPGKSVSELKGKLSIPFSHPINFPITLSLMLRMSHHPKQVKVSTYWAEWWLRCIPDE